MQPCVWLCKNKTCWQFQQERIERCPMAWRRLTGADTHCQRRLAAVKWPLIAASCLTQETLIAIKGHFCSFLLSNIIDYLAFYGFFDVGHSFLLDCSPSICIKLLTISKNSFRNYIWTGDLWRGVPTSLGFYLYIGITSLCLYNNARPLILQDGILYKLNKNNLCKRINLWNITKIPLTNEREFDMLTMLGGL